MNQNLPPFIWTLIRHLRYHRILLTIDDLESLRLSLLAGYGWESNIAFQELCCTLWAKSKIEQEVVRSVFNQLIRDDNVKIEEWAFQSEDSKEDDSMELIIAQQDKNNEADTVRSQDKQKTEMRKVGSLPWINLVVPTRPFVFKPQYPVSPRETIQSFRQLKSPMRYGPKIELDIDRTIEKFSNEGITTEVVLRPRRVNRTQLFLFIERNGGMTPFKEFIDEVVLSIRNTRRLGQFETYYYEKSPIKQIDYKVIEKLVDKITPNIDQTKTEIIPGVEGYFYNDKKLLDKVNIKSIYERMSNNTLVIIISDAGASHSGYETIELVQIYSFIKGLKLFTQNIIWINPLEKKYWKGKIASEISRHLPMVPLTSDGIFEAVNLLKGSQNTSPNKFR